MGAPPVAAAIAPNTPNRIMVIVGTKKTTILDGAAIAVSTGATAPGSIAELIEDRVRDTRGVR